MIKDIRVVLPTRNALVWLTPKDLRTIASRLEKVAEESKGGFAAYRIGSPKEGFVTFQYKKWEWE